MSTYCPANCSVQYLSELYVCALEGCTAPPLRCRQCFGLEHVMLDETGKKRTHPYKKLDESHLYKSLSFLVKIHNTIAQKFSRSFGKINKNSQYFAFQIFSTSEFAVKTFQSQQAIGEFYVLKEIFNKKEAKFTLSPSAELPNSIELFTEKMFNNIQSLLLSPSEEEELLSYYFNQIVNNTSKDLQAFIIEQQDLFTKYCDEIRQQNGAFDIIEYIRTRKNSGNANPDYFSVSFEQFLEQKYGQKPEEQDLFTVNQYVAYTWQNLPVVLLNPTFEQYIDAWVTDYNQYNQFMKKEAFQQNLLSFRMWREHAQAGQAKIQNKYFLDNFVLAFIDTLINSNIEIKGWKDFIKYIKDYVSLSALKNQEFINIGKYSEYFEFRVKNEGFMGHLQQSEDISFNKNYFIECLNIAFRDGVQPSKKNYKKVLASKQEQFLVKQQKLVEVNESLKNQLQQEQGDKFYIIVYNNYVSECLNDDLIPTKQKYYQFKTSLLEQTDEEGIRYENDKFLLQQKETIQSGQATQEIPKSSIVNVQYTVDGAEQELADVQDSENSSGEGAEQIECPCCAGSPETCSKAECQMMGYCVACSL